MIFHVFRNAYMPNLIFCKEKHTQFRKQATIIFRLFFGPFRPSQGCANDPPGPFFSHFRPFSALFRPFVGPFPADPLKWTESYQRTQFLINCLNENKLSKNNNSFKLGQIVPFIDSTPPPPRWWIGCGLGNQ